MTVVSMHTDTLTETRFSSTNGVSTWCLMVAIISLKSMAEMTPFFPLSFWANAWRACSNCSSYKHDTTRLNVSVSRKKDQSENVGKQCVSSAHLQELSELQVAEAFLAVVAEVQTDELTVPVKGNVVVHCGLAEDVPCVICGTNVYTKKQYFNVM